MIAARVHNFRSLVAYTSCSATATAAAIVGAAVVVGATPRAVVIDAIEVAATVALDAVEDMVDVANAASSD